MQPLKKTLSFADEFFAIRPFQLAGALSYFTMLSLAPLLLVLTGVTGMLVDESDVRKEFVDQTRALVGPEGAQLLETVAQNLDALDDGLVSLLTGGILAILGATTVFAQLQAALNRVWHVEPDPANPLLGFLRTRLVSLTVVLGLGFLLLVSLVMSALLAALSDRLAALVPQAEGIWFLGEIAFSLVIYTALIALLFRFVTDAVVAWRDCLLGGFVTAVLFSVGKWLIGLYIGAAAVGSAYGAAGSAVVFMVWVFYASLILFMGAVLARYHGEHNDRPPRPGSHAREATGPPA